MKCPNCNKTWIAKIVYGYFCINELMDKDLKSKKIVLGGCTIDEQSPKWVCNSCGHTWGKKRTKNV